MILDVHYHLLYRRSLFFFFFFREYTGHTHKRPYLCAAGPLTQRVFYVLDNNLRIHITVRPQHKTYFLFFSGQSQECCLTCECEKSSTNNSAIQHQGDFICYERHNQIGGGGIFSLFEKIISPFLWLKKDRFKIRPHTHTRRAALNLTRGKV